MEASQDNFQMKETEIIALQEIIENLKSSLSDREIQLENEKMALKQAQDELQEKSSEISRQNEIISKLEQEILAKLDIIAELKMNKIQLENEISEAFGKISQLENQLEMEKETVQARQVTIQQIVVEIEELQEKVVFQEISASEYKVKRKIQEISLILILDPSRKANK